MIDRITIAKEENFAEIYDFYCEVCAELEGAQYTPRWEIDIYPGKDDINIYIQKQEMIIGWYEEKILSVMVLEAHKSYTSLHLFAVHPKYRGKHIAEEMMKAMIHIVSCRNHTIIQLDVVQGNLPAERLYQKFGFRQIGERTEYYEFTGDLVFYMYEYAL